MDNFQYLHLAFERARCASAHEVKAVGGWGGSQQGEIKAAGSLNRGVRQTPSNPREHLLRWPPSPTRSPDGRGSEGSSADGLPYLPHPDTHTHTFFSFFPYCFSHMCLFYRQSSLLAETCSVQSHSFRAESVSVFILYESRGLRQTPVHQGRSVHILQSLTLSECDCASVA